MKKLAVFFCLLFPILSKGQNWELFPMNQKSYYSTPNNNGFVVRIFHVDSLKTENPNLKYFFNSKNPLLIDGTREDFYPFKWRSLSNEDRPDLIEVSGDSVFIKFYQYESFDRYDFNRFDTFLFLPKALVGESWSLSEMKNLRVVCTSASEELIFGVNDSVKKYRVEAGDGKESEIVLSKHFGLIQFYRFKGLLEGLDEKPLQLFGYEKENIKAGYRQPHFQDYFHLKPGDVLMWTNVYDSYFPRVHVEEYRKDTILKIQHTETELTYSFERITWSCGVASEPKTMITTYSKLEWESLAGSPTEWVSLPDENFSRLFFSRVLNVNVHNNDTITEYSLDHDGLMVNMSDYSRLSQAEFGEKFTLSTKFGLKSYSDHTMFDSNELSLIGTKVNGISNGNLSFPTAIKEISAPHIEVFPNPARGFINVRSGVSFKWFEIFDLNGIKVYSGEIQSQAVPLHALSKGVYVLNLVTEKGTIYRQKIVLN